MSESFQRQWYNFSLVMEGFSLNSYHKLLTSALTVSQREKISAIVITPRSLIVTSEVADRLDSDLPIQGKPKIDFRPKVSVLSFLKKLLTTRSDLEKIYNTIDLNQHGDKIFKTNQTFIPKILPVEINQIDQNQIERYVVKNVCFYKKHFPNANLYFVFPSGYYNQNNLPILINSANYISNTVSLNYKYNVGTGVRFIVQPPYTNIAQLHDTAWHASETGRHWRTLNLINALSSIKSP